MPSISNFKLNINESDEHGFNVIDFIVSTLRLIKQVNFFLRHPVYTNKDLHLHVERICKDSSLWEEVMLPELTSFYFSFILKRNE